MTAQRVAAFGALNGASYSIFREELEKAAAAKNMQVDLICAGPYPNAEAVAAPGRPLRAEALQDPARREELLSAVAGDAQALPGNFDVYCMPCMSMIGFHDGIEAKLSRPIARLADALTSYYMNVPRVGVIHMRPAAQRVKEMFGDKAVTPDESQLQDLLAAEERARQERNPAAVEDVMAKITVSFRDGGVGHVLFARADAPGAMKGPAGRITGIQINSYFDILAGFLVARA